MANATSYTGATEPAVCLRRQRGPTFHGGHKGRPTLCLSRTRGPQRRPGPSFPSTTASCTRRGSTSAAPGRRNSDRAQAPHELYWQATTTNCSLAQACRGQTYAKVRNPVASSITKQPRLTATPHKPTRDQPGTTGPPPLQATGDRRETTPPFPLFPYDLGLR